MGRTSILLCLAILAATALLVALFDDVPGRAGAPGRDAGSTHRPGPADDLTAPGGLDRAGAGTLEAAIPETAGRAVEDATRTAIGATELVVEVTADGAPAAAEVLVMGPGLYETLRADESGRILLEARPGSYEVFVPRDSSSEFTPLGAASEGEAEVLLGERSTIRLEVGRAATLTISFPDGYSGPSHPGLVELFIEEKSRWVPTNQRPKVDRNRSTWSGLEPGRYRLRGVVLGGAHREITLASGEQRTLELDLGLRPVTLTVEARSRATGRLVRVPLGATVEYGGSGDKFHRSIETVLVSGRPRTLQVFEGAMRVTLTEESRRPVVLSDVKITGDARRSFRAEVTGVGASAMHEIEVDLPAKLAVREFRFDDTRPPSDSYAGTLVLPGVEGFRWLNSDEAYVALDLDRLEDGPLRIFDGSPERNRELWSEILRPGWASQTFRLTR